ncbi:MAG: transglycosylase [Sphingomonadales bacterium 32-64-17]|nr:MAG: transglycosylase [Sphingomonadales bacterium 32-64-17]
MMRDLILLAGRSAAPVSLACAAALAATPARADVLEIGGEGAYWVAGPALGQEGATAQQLSASYAPQAALEQVPDDIAVPEVAVAVPERHAAIVPDTYDAKVRELARRFDLSPALIEALVWQESRWHAGAVSPKGARGLAQLMPGTARQLGVDASDPFANLEGGARYLREQLDRFDGDLEKALAAYNAGPGRVESAGGVPNIRETKAYVAAIMGRLSNHSRSTD